MEYQNDFIYCHNRNCERGECLRKETYMPYNVVCRRADFECSKSNGYQFFLDTVPDEEEVLEDLIKSSKRKEKVRDTKEDREYVRVLNDIVSHSEGLKFYIEPFVGNSESFDKIDGNFIKYGTDIDADKIKEIKNRIPSMEKNLKVCDFKTWGNVLTDEKYRGKCIVYCESPCLDMENEFSLKDLLVETEKWSHYNRVFVKMRQKAKNWEFVCKIDDNYSLFEVHELKK